MKTPRWIGIALVLALAACGVEEQTNLEQICADTTFAIGSVPAKNGYFHIDCVLGDETSSPRYECSRLEFGFELSDGTKVELSGSDEIDLYFHTGFEPNDGRGTQVSFYLQTEKVTLSDGRNPHLTFDVPDALYAVGTMPAATVDAQCVDAETCARFLIGAGEPHASTYLLGVAPAFNIQVDAAGTKPGERIALSASSIAFEGAERNGVQAVCDDGKIHYQP